MGQGRVTHSAPEIGRDPGDITAARLRADPPMTFPRAQGRRRDPLRRGPVHRAVAAVNALVRAAAKWIVA